MDIKIIDWEECPVISIFHREVSLEDLPKIIGTSFMKIAAYIYEAGGKIKDAPFVAYHGLNEDNLLDDTNLEVEIGFPIEKTITDKDSMKCYIRESGKVVTTAIKGSYAGISEVYGKMSAMGKENGYKTKGISYENYLSDPSTPEEERITVISIPII